MVRSMTGFGAGAAREAGWNAEVTIRTWNHRYLSVRTRSLGDRPGLQARVEERVKQSFQRGEVGVWIDLQPDRSADLNGLFDRVNAQAVFDELCTLADTLALPRPTMSDLIRAGGLQSAEESDAEVWLALAPALDGAIEQADAARSAEGRVLGEELARLLADLSSHVAAVESRLPQVLDDLRQRLIERVDELEVSVEPDRFETELALLVDRFDVQEELVRLGSHINRASTRLEDDGVQGKELDFLCQELLREVNTIGSKARDTQISSAVIDMKLCVEQLREQVQNVE